MWKITKKDIAPLISKQETQDLIAKVALWRAERQIPKLVQLKDGDNMLLINLEHQDAVIMWLNTVKNRKYLCWKNFYSPKKVS